MNKLKKGRQKELQMKRGEKLAQEVKAGSFTDTPPSLEWIVGITFPFSYSLSKNAIWSFGKGGHVFLRKKSKSAREEITLILREALSKSKVQIVQNKLWISLFVEKPNAKGDAVNVIDLVCDAIKDASNLDDRWYSIKRLDWTINKIDPKVHLTIGQENSVQIQACSNCGRLLSFDNFGSHKGNRFGLSRICKGCSSGKIRVKTLK